MINNGRKEFTYSEIQTIFNRTKLTGIHLSRIKSLPNPGEQSTTRIEITQPIEKTVEIIENGQKITKKKTEDIVIRKFVFTNIDKNGKEIFEEVPIETTPITPKAEKPTEEKLQAGTNPANKAAQETEDKKKAREARKQREKYHFLSSPKTEKEKNKIVQKKMAEKKNTSLNNPDAQPSENNSNTLNKKPNLVTKATSSKEKSNDEADGKNEEKPNNISATSDQKNREDILNKNKTANDKTAEEILPISSDGSNPNETIATSKEERQSWFDIIWNKMIEFFFPTGDNNSAQAGANPSSSTNQTGFKSTSHSLFSKFRNLSLFKSSNEKKSEAKDKNSGTGVSNTAAPYSRPTINNHYGIHSTTNSQKNNKKYSQHALVKGITFSPFKF
jgi:hypothetical protein